MKASIVCLLFAGLFVIVLPRGNEGHQLKKKVTMEEIDREIFNEYDADSNGYLSFDELSNVVSDQGMNGYENYTMTRLDTDKDGQISFEEYQAFS